MNRIGFRRRCGWCGVELRAWQINLCREDHLRAHGDAGIYLRAGGPTWTERSRWDAEPDPAPQWVGWLRRLVARKA